MKIGVFIGRMQPLHIGHQAIIKNILSNNDLIFIFLGGNGKVNYSNPFTYEQRKLFLESVFGIQNKMIISELRDMSSDEEWVIFIKNILLKNRDGKKIHINFYHGDFLNDSAHRTLRKNSSVFEGNGSTYSFIEQSRGIIPISSTLVRKMLWNKEYNLVSENVGIKVLEQILLVFQKC